MLTYLPEIRALLYGVFCFAFIYPILTAYLIAAGLSFEWPGQPIIILPGHPVLLSALPTIRPISDHSTSFSSNLDHDSSLLVVMTANQQSLVVVHYQPI